jgi:hypothetical protein
VIWSRARFDGDRDITPIVPAGEFRLYVYTNNYAVRADTFASGADVSDVMQHNYANRMVEEKVWNAHLAHNAPALSVTNKSPCTWNYLNKARQSGNSRDALVQLVEHYAWTSIELDGDRLWIEPYVRAAQGFFRSVLRDNKLR